MVCRVECFGGGFVEILPELTPEAVQHEFGGGLSPWVLDNKVWIEVDSFLLLVLIDILSFICRGNSPSGVASRLLLDFELGVDIFGKESYLVLFWWEVVDFVDLDEGVPVFHGFLDFRGTPFSSERTLLEGVVTETIFLAGVWTFPLPCRLDRVGT